MLGAAAERAREHLMLQPTVLHTAAIAMAERYDAIDIGIVFENALVELLGDRLANRRGTIDGRDERQIVARAGLAIGALVL